MYRHYYFFLMDHQLHPDLQEIGVNIDGRAAKDVVGHSAVDQFVETL